MDTEFKYNFLQEVRSERNKRLSETDYIHFPDVIINGELKLQYLIYRQKLRDITSVIDQWLSDKDITSVSVFGVPWPEKPIKID